MTNGSVDPVSVVGNALVASYPSRFRNQSRVGQTARQVVKALEDVGWGPWGPGSSAVAHEVAKQRDQAIAERDEAQAIIRSMKVMDLPPGIPDVHDYGRSQRLAVILASGETVTQIPLSDFAWTIQRLLDLETQLTAFRDGVAAGIVKAK